MPLQVTERQAVGILLAEIAERDGDTAGLQNFARTHLGAHSEQAKELVGIADGVYQYGWEFTDFKDVTLSLNTEAGTLEASEPDHVDRLLERVGLDPEAFESTEIRFWGDTKSPKVSVGFKRRDYRNLVELDREQFKQDMIAYAPTYSEVEYPGMVDHDLMMEIVLADLHIGKLAPGVTLGGVEKEAQKMFAHFAGFANAFGVGQIRLVSLGDLFHADNARGTTSAGTVVGVDPNWREVYSTGRNILRSGVETLVGVAPVIAHVVPGNHDRERTYYTADSLEIHFTTHPNVLVWGSDDRQYIRWGTNLIGLTHGNEEKPANLPMILIRENQEELGGVGRMEWHLGHYHTRTVDEHQGVLLRRFGTSSGDDDWSARKGFVGNTREVTAIMWHRAHGKVGEFSYTWSDVNG